VGIKITRKLQKIFASLSNPNEIGKFGSFAAGLPAYSTDPDQIQTANFLGGWFSAIVGANSPAIEDLNALQYLYARQLAYLFQNGIAEWQAGTEYFIGSTVMDSKNIYTSIVDNNIGNLVTDITKWQIRTPMTSIGDLIYGGAGGKETRLPAGADGQALQLAAGIPSWVQPVPAGVVSAFAGAVAPSGYLLCNGASVLTATYPNLFAAIGYTYGGAGANFTMPDLRGRTIIGVGTGAGLSVRTLNQAVGEENHLLTIPEMPSHTHVQDPHHHTYSAPFGGNSQWSSNSSGPSTVNTGDTIAVNNPTGGGGTHNNMQPSRGLNYIIKY
jgi:microcystin-dependent protein